MNTTAAEAGETLVAASVAVTVRELAPATRVTEAVHAPLVAWAVTDVSSVEPLNTFTVEPASAVPDSDSEVDLVEAAAVEMVGAAGAVWSRVNTTAAEAGDTLVAASVAVAVRELAPATRVTDVVHAPDELAVVEAIDEPERIMLTVEFASAVPDSDSVADLVVVAEVDMVGAAGAV